MKPFQVKTPRGSMFRFHFRPSTKGHSALITVGDSAGTLRSVRLQHEEVESLLLHLAEVLGKRPVKRTFLEWLRGVQRYEFSTLAPYSAHLKTRIAQLGLETEQLQASMPVQGVASVTDPKRSFSVVDPKQDPRDLVRRLRSVPEDAGF